MKKFNLNATLLVLSVFWLLMSSALKDPSNPPVAKTGAPGEATCSTTAGCHSGGTFVGTSELIGLPDTIVAGETYQLTIKHKSNAQRTGFELTCLDDSNAKCGTLMAGSGSNVKTNLQNNRDYLRQTNAKLLSNGEASWSFAWTAPTTTSAASATFYMATLAANNNDKDSGDNAILGTQKAHFAMTTPTKAALGKALKVVIAPNPSTGVFRLSMAEDCTLTVYTIAGKKVRQLAAQDAMEVNLTDLESAGYYFHFTNGKRSSIQRVSLIR